MICISIKNTHYILIDYLYNIIDWHRPNRLLAFTFSFGIPGTFYLIIFSILTVPIDKNVVKKLFEIQIILHTFFYIAVATTERPVQKR